jgi:hypothetical protein
MNPAVNKKHDPAEYPSRSQSDALTELIRHSVDLRIHAIIMLGSTVLVAYCGLRASGAYGDGTSDNPESVLSPTDSLSLLACVVFASISIACLIEAHRFWRKAASIRLEAKVDHARHLARGYGAAQKAAASHGKGVAPSLQTLKQY